MLPQDRADAVAFCERVRPKLVGALSLYCGDALLAEEHAHEALIQVWQHWSRVKDMAAPEAWAVRVGVNSLNSGLRRRRIERRALQRLAARPSAPAAPPSAEHLHVRRAVAALPRRQRTALVLRHYLDLSVEQTAVVMNCAPGTVKSLTSKAMSQLQVSLSQASEREVSR